MMNNTYIWRKKYMSKSISEIVNEKIKEQKEAAREEIKKEETKKAEERLKLIKAGKDLVSKIYSISTRLNAVDIPEDSKEISVDKLEVSETESDSILKLYNNIFNNTSVGEERMLYLVKLKMTIKGTIDKIVPKYGYFDNFSEIHNDVAEIIETILGENDPKKKYNSFISASIDSPIVFDACNDPVEKKCLKLKTSISDEVGSPLLKFIPYISIYHDNDKIYIEFITCFVQKHEKESVDEDYDERLAFANIMSNLAAQIIENDMSIDEEDVDD